MAEATQKRKFDPSMGRPFQKGNRASVGMGRGGKLKALKDAYKAVVEEIDPKTGETYAYLIARQVRTKALRGNMPAVMELGNRIHGKPTQPVQLEVGIDDKTAATIAELATQYKLLEPSEQQPTILVAEQVVAQQVNVHPLGCTCHLCELNRKAARLPQVPKGPVKMLDQAQAEAPEEVDRAYDESKVRQVTDPFPRL